MRLLVAMLQIERGACGCAGLRRVVSAAEAAAAQNEPLADEQRRVLDTSAPWRFFLNGRKFAPTSADTETRTGIREIRHTPRPRPKKIIAYFGPYSTPEKCGKNVFNSPVN